MTTDDITSLLVIQRTWRYFFGVKNNCISLVFFEWK